MYSQLQAQNERAQRWMNEEKQAFEALEREKTLHSKRQLELQCQLNPIAQRIASVDAQIRALEKQRHVMQAEFNSTKQAMTSNTKSMQRHEKAKRAYIAQQGKHAHSLSEGQSLLSVIESMLKGRLQATRTQLSAKIGLAERGWKQWDETHVVWWLKCIEHGRFNNTQTYGHYFEHIIGDKVRGTDLVNINDLLLRLCGVDNINDRASILRNIRRVTMGREIVVIDLATDKDLD